MGRAPECMLRIDDPQVSAEHASVFWAHGEWAVRDLGSSNGTRVDGKSIEPGARHTLARGSELHLGSDRQRWVLVDSSPPGAGARCPGTETYLRAEDGLLILPSADQPVMCLHMDERGQWMLEHDHEAWTVHDQESIDIHGVEWILELPPAMDQGVATTQRRAGQAPCVLDTVTLCFKPSRDEEYVELMLRSAQSDMDLGARTYTYMLLTLARARIEDRGRGAMPADEHGWMYVDELAGSLGLELSQLNINVFRARQQLARAGVIDADKLVERRSTSRQIRLGTERVEIG